MFRRLGAVAFSVLAATLTAPAFAQQPPITAPWMVEDDPINYKKLKKGDVLSFSSVDQSHKKFKLDVHGVDVHELEAPEYMAGSMCRVRVKDKKVFKSEKAAREVFDLALNLKNCKDTLQREFYFHGKATLGDHKHNGHEGSPHEHLVVLFRVCLEGKEDSCAKTHFAVLFFEANTNLSDKSNAKVFNHNGLIHGPH
jgi:hypothetical protein